MTKRGSDVEQSIDALYEAAPAAFTKERDALAKRLKAQASDAASARVKALRKPTAIAYVLNQLARRHPDELAELVDVGRVLARAQRKALRGEAGNDLRDAITKQRAVVTALTAQTAAVMKELGLAGGHLDAIAAALQAALVDPAVGEQLEEGRLEKVPEAASGFPGASAGPVEEVDEPARVRTRAEKASPHAAPAKTDAKARAKADAERVARAKADARAQELARAKAERKERRAALETRASALEAEAKTAMAASAEAKRAAAVAAHKATAAVAAARRARGEVRSAR